MFSTTAIFPALPSLEAPAMALAQQFNLPFTLTRQSAYEYLLVVTPDYVGLQRTEGTSLPWYIDFLSGKVNYRFRHTSLKSEALARAMGLKGNTHPRIVDATGGLAGDAFVLASLGFEVTALERSPIVYILVMDAIQRAQKNSQIAPIINRLQWVHVDAMAWFSQVKHPERPEIVYIDPMFPERKKSALPRQEMLILHDIVGADADADRLLMAALACATQRVVVKRPRLASVFAVGTAPSFALSGSSSRFDVYLTRE